MTTYFTKQMQSQSLQMQAHRRPVLLPPQAPAFEFKTVVPSVAAPKTPANVLTALNASGVRMMAQLQGRMDTLTVR